MDELIHAITNLSAPAMPVYMTTNNRIDSVVWLSDDIAKPSDDAIKAEMDRLLKLVPISELREQRNALLASSDWTGLSDTALTNEQAAKWKLYRQKLRDLPTGLTTEFKVKNVKWPTAPG